MGLFIYLFIFFPVALLYGLPGSPSQSFQALGQLVGERKVWN